MELSLLALDDVFPFSRAMAAGLSPADLRRLLRSGACHRLHHGWFTTKKPADATERHRLRVAALVQEYAGRAVASHGSALLRLGLPTFRPDLVKVHLTLLDAGRRRHSKPDLVVHAAAATNGLTPTGFLTVHPAVAIAEVGLADPRALLVPADAAVRRGVVTVGEISRAVSALDRRPGVDRARTAATLVDGRHESPGETLTAWVLRLLGHELEPQFTVPASESWTPGRRGYRVDFLIKGSRVVVEFDGRGKYETPEALWQEKQREDRIRSLGYEVVRLTWTDLQDTTRVQSLVTAALARSRKGRSLPR